MRILIIGAGIIGLTTAYLLVQRGHHVLVVERESAPGKVSSYMNGGQFSYSYAEPLASPAMLRLLPKMLVGRDGALKINPGALPEILPWGVKFLRNCTAERFAKNTQTVLRLALLSREEMGRFVDSQAADFQFRETGKLHLYQDPGRLQDMASLVELKNSLGFKQEIWGPEQCLAREPALLNYQGTLVGGVFSPLDQSGDTFQLIQVLTAACLGSGRCELMTQIEVSGFKAERHGISGIYTGKGQISADAYVLCAGAESPRLLGTLGQKLPIVPVKGYSITVPVMSHAPVINLTDTQHKIVFTKLGGSLRVAGLMEFAGHNRQNIKKSIDRILQLAMTVLPQAGDYSRLNACWAGLRPMTPDSVPLIGPSRWRNLWLNTGHGMLGSTLAFGSARLTADLLDGEDNAICNENLEPGRFA